VRRLRQYVLRALYRWKGRKKKLGYRNYWPWQLMAFLAVLGVVGGLLIGSFK